jgi:hypothetical protein
MKHKLEIKPAIAPRVRHKIEDLLGELGYNVYGGGTDTDLSSCDISFEDKVSGDRD